MFREVDFKNKYKSNVYFIMVNDLAHRRRRQRRDNSTAATTISATRYSPFIIRHTVVTLHHRHTMQCIHILYVARVPHDMIESELERFEKKNRIK